MNRRIEDPDDIELAETLVQVLRNDMIKIFAENTGKNILENHTLNPKLFWKTYGKEFYSNFTENTNFKRSRISLNSSNQAKGELPISKEYFYSHLILGGTKKFQIVYLNRIIYYITKNNESDQYYKYFKLKGFDLYDGELRTQTLSQAVKNLTGWWIGLNRNLEQGSIAKCQYLFEEKDNKMFVSREAYNAETMYHGEVYVQDDSQFVFDLIGETLKRKKFIIAHTGKVKPFSIKCISSGFEVKSGKPIFIKEILFKIKDRKFQKLGRGQTINNAELNEELKQYFTDEEEYQQILSEINDFLGIDYVSYLSPQDFNLIKTDHLKDLKIAEIEPNIIKKLCILYRFEKLGGIPYEREIIKYFRKKGQQEEIPKIENLLVIDQYTKIRINRYITSNSRLHRVYYETDSETSAVDVQSLFPILDSDSDNDLKYPMLRVSNRIMDADSDSYISSATIFNEFLHTKMLAVRFDEKTMKTEVIMDFCSVQESLSKQLSISEITLHYNQPGEETSKEVSFKVDNLNQRGFVFQKLDKTTNILEVTQKASIDPFNPRIFNLNINFETDIGDILYIHFKI